MESEVTRILNAMAAGDVRASRQLLPLVYTELRKLAAQKMAQENPGQTLQATALVHEAYLRVANSDEMRPWNSRGHFFAAAAEAMRRILVENARQKAAMKRGSEHRRLELSAVEPQTQVPCDDVIALHEALEKLEALHPRKAELVKLRFFAGLTNEQAAEMLGISTSTADNDWVYARAWLRVEISGDKGTKNPE